ncbi:DUF4159 domain-containing protein, partial [Candidatus Latescibacterota bacterium]
LRMPFIYIAADESFEISDTEKTNLKKYFDSGGFMVLDNAIPYIENSQAGASLKKLLRDTLGSQARFNPIPNDHPIYHCFFQFDDGPPLGAEMRISTRNVMRKPVHYLEGVWYKGRLAAVYSDKGYIVKWNDMVNNNPQLKMGVNLIVFALTQPGGIASR